MKIKTLYPMVVANWVMKPVEIDDVPIVTLALRPGDSEPQSDGYSLRRVGEEIVERLATIPNVSRAFLVGGESRNDYDQSRFGAIIGLPNEHGRSDASCFIGERVEYLNPIFEVRS